MDVTILEKQYSVDTREQSGYGRIHFTISDYIAWIKLNVMDLFQLQIALIEKIRQDSDVLVKYVDKLKMPDGSLGVNAENPYLVVKLAAKIAESSRLLTAITEHLLVRSSLRMPANDSTRYELYEHLEKLGVDDVQS